MGCSGNNGCGESWKPPVIAPNTPWDSRLVGLPSNAAISQDVAAAFKGRVWSGDHWYQRMSSLHLALGRAGVTVTASLTRELQDWAVAQWASNPNNRGRFRVLYSADTTSSLKEFFDDAGESGTGEFSRTGGPWKVYEWGPGFWETWNVLALDETFDAQSLPRFVWMARKLIHGPSGCDDCAASFQRHLAAYPPERVTNANMLRVWLWHIHNLANPDVKDAPFNKIAARFGWPPMQGAAVNDILKMLSRSK